MVLGGLNKAEPMKTIDISSPKYPNYYTLVDDADYLGLTRWKWRVLSHRGVTVMRGIRNGKGWGSIYMHRFILGIDDPKVEVIHLDGNGLNNQRSNLRAVTPRDRVEHSRCKISKSLPKGITQEGMSYEVIARTRGKTKYIGRFKKLEDAVTARNSAIKKMHGKYSRKAEAPKRSKNPPNWEI